MTQATLLFALLLLVGSARSDTLTLDQAVNVALRNSPVIEAAAARADAAKDQYREAIGHWLPSVDITEMFARTTNPAESFGFQLNQERFSMQEFGNPANDPNNPDPLNTAMTRAEASMPLYTGGMLPARTRQAGLMKQSAQLDLDRARNQVIFDVTKAYTDLQKARENDDLMQRTREMVQGHVDRARAYYEEGMLVSSDLLRAEVQLSEIDEWVTRAQNGVRLAEAALNFHLGLPREVSHDLATLPEFPNEVGDLNDWIAGAADNRQDLNAARLKVKAGDYEGKAARASFLPEIGVQARYDFYDDRLFGNHGESWAIMGVAKLNLFRGGADRAKWAKARHEARANHSDVNRFAEGVRLEVQQAHGDLEAALLRHETAQSALAAGRENLRVTEERFGQGVAKMLDLIDAQTALRDLEVRELSSRYDAYLANYRLKHAAGQPIIQRNEDN